jgi:hypothetical protein
MRWPDPLPTFLLPTLLVVLAACSPAPSEEHDRRQAAEAFAAFRQDYLLDYWSHHPIEATQAGQVQYASRLPALGTSDIEHQIRQLEGHLEWLEATPDSVMNNAKLQSARNQIRAHAIERLLLLQASRRWQTDPRLYLAEPAFLQLGDPELGSPEQRASWLVSRLEQLPVLLETGLSNLVDPPQRFTIDAIRSGERIRSNLNTLVAALGQEAPDFAPALQSSLTTARARIQSYVERLRTEVLPDSRISAGVGADVYERFLLEVHGLDLSAEEWTDQAELAWQQINQDDQTRIEERRYRALVWLDARMHSGQFTADAARHFLIDELGMSHPDTAQEVDNLLQYPARILNRPPEDLPMSLQLAGLES